MVHDPPSGSSSAAHLLQPLLTPPAPPGSPASPVAARDTSRGGGRSSDAEAAWKAGGPAGGASGRAGSAPHAGPDRSPGSGAPGLATAVAGGGPRSGAGRRRCRSGACWSGRWAPPSAPAGRASAWPGPRPSPGPPRAGPPWWSCAWWWTTTGGAHAEHVHPVGAGLRLPLHLDQQRPPGLAGAHRRAGLGGAGHGRPASLPLGDVPALVRRPPAGGRRQPAGGASGGAAVPPRVMVVANGHLVIAETVADVRRLDGVRGRAPATFERGPLAVVADAFAFRPRGRPGGVPLRRATGLLLGAVLAAGGVAPPGPAPPAEPAPSSPGRPG